MVIRDPRAQLAGYGLRGPKVCSGGTSMVLAGTHASATTSCKLAMFWHALELPGKHSFASRFRF